MTDKAGANWTKRNVMVAIGFGLATMLCMSVTTAPTWVPFVEERGYDAAWLLPYLEWVGKWRWWRVVFAGAGLVLAGALLRWFRRQVIRPFRWLGGLGKRFYLWVLWQLVVRPARDHMYWGASVGHNKGKVLMEKDALPAVRRLSDAAAVTLALALEQSERGGKEGVVLMHASAAYLASLAGDERDPFGVLVEGCEELMIRGLLTGYGRVGSSAVTAGLHPVVRGLRRDRIVKLLEDELLKRGITDF